MNRCDELAPLLAAHASGEIAPAEREEIEAHLAQCEACRAEREDLAEVLSLAALPAPTELELKALGGMPGQVRAAWQAQERVRGGISRWTVAAVAAAALLAFGLGRLPHGRHRSARAPEARVVHVVPVARVAAPAEPAQAATNAAATLAVEDLAGGPPIDVSSSDDSSTDSTDTLSDAQALNDFSLEGDE